MKKYPSLLVYLILPLRNFYTPFFHPLALDGLTTNYSMHISNRPAKALQSVLSSSAFPPSLSLSL